METNFVKAEFDALIVLVKKMRKASCHHEKLKMRGSGKKKVERSISSIKRVTGNYN